MARRRNAALAAFGHALPKRAPKGRAPKAGDRNAAKIEREPGLAGGQEGGAPMREMASAGGAHAEDRLEAEGPQGAPWSRARKEHWAHARLT